MGHTIIEDNIDKVAESPEGQLVQSMGIELRFLLFLHWFVIIYYETFDQKSD